MKKLLFLSLCAMATMSLSAQKSLVDDVEHQISGFSVSLDNYKAAAKKIVPALTNDETKGEAKTWFTAGKASVGVYDQYFGLLQLGKESEVDKALMSTSLLDAYDYFTKALPLDTVIQTNKDGSPKLDKKTGLPKVKTEYSKDIVSTLVQHHMDFNRIGSNLYDLKMYKEACKAWGICVDMPASGIAERDKFMLEDTILGQISFYRAIAAWQGEDFKTAVDAFAKARKLGYQTKETFDYAMSCYANLKDNDGIVSIAKEALPIFGDKDPQYMNIIINDMINKEQYADALSSLDKALAATPNSAELYNLKGFVKEQQKEEDEALALYKKSAELNPEYTQGQFNAGRVLVKKAVALQAEADKISGPKFQQFIKEKITPLYKEALPFMKKAYDLDPSDNTTKRLLGNIYYRLNMETELNALGL